MVREGFQVHFLQKTDFGVSDFLSGGTNLVIFGDFDLTFLNFGGDLQGVEERNLRGVHSGGSRGDDNV